MCPAAGLEEAFAMSTKRERLRKAEKLLRQGRLDGAIAEYVKVLEEEPGDWATTNALGDLYVRAKQVDQAVGQYTRIAEHFWKEGFYPKAAALYKKILKVKATDEPSQLRLAEISAQQGLMREAKAHMTAVVKQRNKRGDSKGANEVIVKLGQVDPSDFKARRNSAKALVELGQIVEAIEALNQLAGDLSDKGKSDEAVKVLKAVVELDPANDESRGMLARAYLATGNLDAAREYLTPEVAGDDPTMLLAVAELQLRGGQRDEGREIIRKVIGLNPDTGEHVLALASSLCDSDPDAAFVGVDTLADVAIAAEDWEGAAGMLQEFVSRVPQHVDALVKLVEVCVDGSLDDAMMAAQGLLADAHLAAGRADEACVIAEDLVARDPSNKGHIERYRQVLVKMGDPDPEAKIAGRVSGGSGEALDGLDELGADFFDEPEPEPSAPPVPSVDLDEPVVGGEATEAVNQPTPQTRPPAGGDSVVELSASAIDISGILGDDLGQGDAVQIQTEAPAPAAPPVSAPPTPAATSPGPMEIDLTSILGDLTPTPAQVPSAPAPEPEPPTVPTPAPIPAPSLDEVFEGMRDEVPQEQPPEEAAAQQYQLGLSYRQMGKIDEAIQALETAACSARYRFNSAVMLGRLYFDKKESARAVDWLERAAESPAPSEDDHRALLYHLGVTLERLGETARALAVFMELQADVGDYRDVSQRVGQLARAQTGG